MNRGQSATSPMFRRDEPTNPPAALTVAQAAQAMNLSQATIWKLIGRGELRSLLVGTKARRILWKDLMAWAEAQAEATMSERADIEPSSVS